MSKQAINDLHALVKKLQAERDAHEAAIADIDDAFTTLGVTGTPKKRRGRRPGRPKKAVAKNGRRKAAKRGRPKGKRKSGKKATKGKPKAKGRRGKRSAYKVTANDLVLSVVKKSSKGVTGAQINKAWKVARRPGDAYNVINALINAKKLKKHSVKGQRGSLFTAA